MNFVCHNRNINYHDNNNLTTTTRSTRNLAFKVDDLKISGRNIFWPKLISNSNLMDFLISRFVQIKLVSSQAEQLGIHFWVNHNVAPSQKLNTEKMEGE